VDASDLQSEVARLGLRHREYVGGCDSGDRDDFVGRARSTPVGWVFVVITNTGGRATVGRVRDPAGGGSWVVVVICYNI